VGLGRTDLGAIDRSADLHDARGYHRPAIFMRREHLGFLRQPAMPEDATDPGPWLSRQIGEWYYQQAIARIACHC
jgi:hypothetical protein